LRTGDGQRRHFGGQSRSVVPPSTLIPIAKV
jgi:hypothetical protein